MTDEIVLTISWNSADKAEVLYIIDNNRQVDLSRGVAGRGQLTVSWTSPKAPLHFIAWTLVFVGAQLKSLSAKVSVNGGEPQELAKSDSSYHAWKAYGATK